LVWKKVERRKRRLKAEYDEVSLMLHVCKYDYADGDRKFAGPNCVLE
jgi:hypothetical protein